MSNVNLNHLKAFVKVVQTKSYQEAGRILNVSQPAITLRIKALEDHFQTKLFTRKTDGLTLTPQGEHIYKECIALLERWEQLELNILSKEPKGRLLIGASTIPSEYLLPSFLKHFLSTYREVQFKLMVAGTNEVLEWLLQRKIDISITGEPNETAEIESIPIYSDSLKIITPVDEQQPTSLEELLHCRWIIRDKHSNTRQTWEQSLNKAGYDLEKLSIVGELGSTEAVIAAVEAGLGISAVSNLAAERAAKFNRIKIINLPEIDITRTFYLSYLKENKHLSMIHAVLSLIKDVSFHN